jgi:hypothetical protein
VEGTKAEAMEESNKIELGGIMEKYHEKFEELSAIMSCKMLSYRMMLHFSIYQWT